MPWTARAEGEVSNHRSSSISWITLGCAFVGVLYATAGCALMTMQSSTPTGTFYLTNASVAHRTVADARLGIFVREHVSLAGAANLAVCLYNLTNEPIEVEIESIRANDYSGKPGIQTLQPRSTLRLPITKINEGDARGPNDWARRYDPAIATTRLSAARSARGP